MDFVTKLTPEEIKKANEKSYCVTICDDACNTLVLNLSRVEFDTINVFAFVEFGFIVTIKKIDRCIKH